MLKAYSEEERYCKEQGQYDEDEDPSFDDESVVLVARSWRRLGCRAQRRIVVAVVNVGRTVAPYDVVDWKAS